MNPKRKKRYEKELLTIGEIAREFGILSSHVRYYTRLGILKEASRTQGRYRLYRRSETIERLKEISRLKREGLTLEKIKKRINKKGKLEKTDIYTNAKLQEAINIFKSYPVKFAYLFGSYAKDKANSLSDIDIAVYLDENSTDDERFDFRLELINEMTGIFKTNKIDLIILNDSPFLLSFHVIRDGLILYSNDEKKRVAFETKVMSRYFDQQYYYRRHAEANIKRIAMEGIL